MRKLFAILGLAVLAACGGDDGPTEPVIPVVTGQWTAAVDNETLSMTVTSTGQTFSGSGSWGSDAIGVTGTHAHPNVSMIFTFSQYQPINFQGTFSDDNTISGALNGSGFNNYAATFRRQ